MPAAHIAWIISIFSASVNNFLHYFERVNVFARSIHQTNNSD